MTHGRISAQLLLTSELRILRLSFAPAPYGEDACAAPEGALFARVERLDAQDSGLLESAASDRAGN